MVMVDTYGEEKTHWYSVVSDWHNTEIAGSDCHIAWCYISE